MIILDFDCVFFNCFCSCFSAGIFATEDEEDEEEEEEEEEDLASCRFIRAARPAAAAVVRGVLLPSANLN